MKLFDDLCFLVDLLGRSLGCGDMCCCRVHLRSQYCYCQVALEARQLMFLFDNSECGVILGYPCSLQVCFLLCLREHKWGETLSANI